MVKRAPDERDSRLDTMSAPSDAELQAALAAADALIEKPDLAAYRGWLKYLKFRAINDPIRMGPESDNAKEAFLKLIDWTSEIAADPDIISKLRGVQEWAYESQADGSGQPFRINIPLDYDPTHPAGLSLYCHGYSGNHLEHSAGMTAHTGRFDIAVLGRGRGGWYRTLSERDVLDVIQYVKDHWTFDENKIDLNGGSMGGFASMWLGSRYPDLFACARPTCGAALQTPIENMRSLPVYSIHSKDDPIVPIVGSRGPLEHLKDLGGLTIIEETDGFGHASWEWSEGQERSSIWGAQQLRPDPETVSEINYIAFDGMANGAWWAHVAEWGPSQAPAHVRLKLGPANILYGQLDNIARLRLDIAHSPIDPDTDLQLSLDGAHTISLPAPLPDTIDIAIDKQKAGFVKSTESEMRLHTPGAATLLYCGDPVLIVYGTQADPSTNQAMLSAAIAASQSPNPSWPVESVMKSPVDGISHAWNTYGQLPIKADVELTEDDIASKGLILIGTASQNSAVESIAEQLPVIETSDKLLTSDGFSYAAQDNAWALTHFNPAAPAKLILWIASKDADFYQAGAVLPNELLAHGYGADFVLMGHDTSVFAARSFDSHWNWSDGYANSPLLPDEAVNKPDWSTLQADILQQACDADYGIAMLEFGEQLFPSHSFKSVPGVTRYSDMALLQYQDTVYMLPMSGSELLAIAKRLEEFPTPQALAFSSDFMVDAILPDKKYSIATDSSGISSLLGIGILPKDIVWTGIREADAINAHQ